MIAIGAENRQLSLDELAALVELPRRTVRYYVQIGLVDRPTGETRAAYYTQKHLDQLLTIRKWTEAGLSLARIRELLGGGSSDVPPPKSRKIGSVEVCSHLIVDEGVELVIEPGRAGLKPDQVRRLFRAVIAEYKRMSKNSGERG